MRAKYLTFIFNLDYKYITDKLTISLINRVYQRLLYHSRNPIPLEQISDYLRHTIGIYQNSLDRSRKTMDRKNLRVDRVNPECPTPLFKMIFGQLNWAII